MIDFFNKTNFNSLFFKLVIFILISISSIYFYIIVNNLINTLLYEKPTNYSFKVNSFKKTIEIIKQLNFEISDIAICKTLPSILKGAIKFMLI